MKIIVFYTIFIMMNLISCKSNSQKVEMGKLFDNKTMNKTVDVLLTNTDIDSIRYFKFKILRKVALAEDLWTGKNYREIFNWIEKTTVSLGYINEQNFTDKVFRIGCEKKNVSLDSTTLEIKIGEFAKNTFKKDDRIKLTLNLVNITGEFIEKREIIYKVNGNEFKSIYGNFVIPIEVKIFNEKFVKNLNTWNLTKREIEELSLRVFGRYGKFYLSEYKIERDEEIILANIIN